MAIIIIISVCLVTVPSFIKMGENAFSKPQNAFQDVFM